MPLGSLDLLICSLPVIAAWGVGEALSIEILRMDVDITAQRAM